MKWNESTVTKLLITDVKRLDPVTVYLENYEKGRGKLTIEVFGDTWSSYWGAMGASTIEEFVIDCDNHYLSKNLATLAELSEEDYEKFIVQCRKEIIGYRRDHDHTKEKARELWELTKEVEPEKEYFHGDNNFDTLSALGGCEWYRDIPSKDSDLFNYLCRILDAVKACLKERQNQQSAA